jgi:hypothetical protein
MPLIQQHTTTIAKGRFRRELTLGVAVVALVASDVAPAWAETLDEEHSALTAKYDAALDELAVWCEQRELPDEAAIVRGWRLPQAPLTLVVPLPAGAAETPKADDPPPGAAEWRERFDALRKSQGDAAFALARRAASEKRTTLAFRLLHETLREDPQHPEARRMLGYKLRDGRWLTAFEAQKAQSKQVWHEKFGWLPVANLERYEAGERFYQGRGWMNVADEAMLRADIGHGWKIETEHYEVRTNRSLEEGVRLVARLERLNQVWRQFFARFYLSDKDIAKLFKGGAPPRGQAKRHQVTYYRSRDEYVKALMGRQPNIGMTTGYYEPGRRTAFFFAGEERDDSDLYHEATHQLFNEIRPASTETGRAANAWIVEGIACYMESFRSIDSLHGAGNFCTLGGVGSIRLSNACARLLNESFYVPLAELTRLGIDALQNDRRIKALYSQSSGLTYFLIHHDGGRYRDALVDYLMTVYAAGDTPGTLAKLTGADYAELDRKYKEFISEAARLIMEQEQ